MEIAPHLRVRRVGDVTVVCFKDLASAVYREWAVEEIGQELLGLVDSGCPPNILLNFEGRPFVPAAVFEGKLVLLVKRVAAAAGVLGLCHLPGAVLDHFRMNGLANVFDIYEDEGEALRAAISRADRRASPEKPSG